MIKYFATFSREELERLNSLDYNQLYSLCKGVQFNTFGENEELEIFCGVNRAGRLFINVNFYPEGHRSFDFDKLGEAIKWAKKHIKIKEEE